jgi:hypothetical protein
LKILLQMPWFSWFHKSAYGSWINNFLNKIKRLYFRFKFSVWIERRENNSFLSPLHLALCSLHSCICCSESHWDFASDIKRGRVTWDQIKWSGWKGVLVCF